MNLKHLYCTQQLRNYLSNESFEFLQTVLLCLNNDDYDRLTFFIGQSRFFADLKDCVKGKTFYAVDGCIGTGKSHHLTTIFRNNIIIDEPVHMWECIRTSYGKKDDNILTAFYKTISVEGKNSFVTKFQTIVLVTKVLSIREQCKKYCFEKNFMIERTPEAD